MNNFVTTSVSLNLVSEEMFFKTIVGDGGLSILKAYRSTSRSGELDTLHNITITI